MLASTVAVKWIFYLMIAATPFSWLYVLSCIDNCLLKRYHTQCIGLYTGPNGIKAVCLCVLLITYNVTRCNLTYFRSIYNRSTILSVVNYMLCSLVPEWDMDWWISSPKSISTINIAAVFVFVLYVLLDHCCIWRLALTNKSHITRWCHYEICTESKSTPQNERFRDNKWLQLWK